MLACQAVVFEGRRPDRIESPPSFHSGVTASAFVPQSEAGGKGIRTPGLLIANETLYQLSYTPKLFLAPEFNASIQNSHPNCGSTRFAP